MTLSSPARRAIAASTFALVAAAPALAQDAPLREVRYGTNWVAQAEHGGYYQAVADGTYEACGLSVEIVPGGPQANNRMLLPVGRIDFYMGGNMIQAFSAIQEEIPTLVVAASFQKEPQILMSHPGVHDTFESLKDSQSIYVGREGQATFYQWLVTEYGFTEEQVKPYTFNPAPFIADTDAVQQGYLTSEPLAVEREAGFAPNVFLLADYGFDTYSTTIETRRELVEQEPDVVQCFVDGSAIGWYNYLYGDNAAANEMIKADNPEMTDDQIAYSIEKLKEYGIVDSGDALELGIGAMTDARMESFFGKMVEAGLFPADLDYAQAYTLAFVNKGVGLELRPAQ
ncbi:ABC transporter substrate-binding protein [Salinarimonas rosea]|uniref:ABC transporter substrate-binding protein n=1 Tax=Salinarimonas rosea TaxID=552063 RepID=UPI0003F5FB21|nr:ABC transporter substrate-binding protein [Salinarimonas rosea]